MNETIGFAIPLFIIVVLGFIAGKLGARGRGGPAWLEMLVAHFALPALVFVILAGARFDEALPFTFVIGTTLSTYLTFMLMFVVAVTVGRVPISPAAMQASAASHGNASHLGVPVAASLFGAEGALAAALILFFDRALQSILVPLLHAVGRPKGARIAIVEPLRAIALSPMMIAVALGCTVALSSFEVPPIVSRTLDHLADAAIGGALFAVGVALACHKIGHVTWEVPVIAMFKLVVSPVIMLAVLVMLGGIDPVWISTAVLVAALPTAASVATMAARLDTYANGAANCHLVTTLVSVATISALLVLVTEDRLPLTTAQLFP